MIEITLDSWRELTKKEQDLVSTWRQEGEHAGAFAPSADQMPPTAPLSLLLLIPEELEPILAKRTSVPAELICDPDRRNRQMSAGLVIDTGQYTTTLCIPVTHGTFTVREGNPERWSLTLTIAPQEPEWAQLTDWIRQEQWIFCLLGRQGAITCTIPNPLTDEQQAEALSAMVDMAEQARD